MPWLVAKPHQTIRRGPQRTVPKKNASGCPECDPSFVVFMYLHISTEEKHEDRIPENPPDCRDCIWTLGSSRPCGRATGRNAQAVARGGGNPSGPRGRTAASSRRGGRLCAEAGRICARSGKSQWVHLCGRAVSR